MVTDKAGQFDFISLTLLLSATRSASASAPDSATGSTTVMLGSAISGLSSADITVNKGSKTLTCGTGYTLNGLLNGTAITITFTASAALTNTDAITIVILKDGYLVNGGNAIFVTSSIPSAGSGSTGGTPNSSAIRISTSNGITTAIINLTAYNISNDTAKAPIAEKLLTNAVAEVTDAAAEQCAKATVEISMVTGGGATGASLTIPHTAIRYFGRQQSRRADSQLHAWLRYL